MNTNCDFSTDLIDPVPCGAPATHVAHVDGDTFALCDVHADECASDNGVDVHPIV